ncbi:MAG: gliding motility-associated C-terminal domain-containing protein, partial [Flavobacteriaceae bacterium]
IHDSWKIKGYVFTPESIIKIYNLAGSLVFQHQGEYANDWEGTAASNGERLPQGSYYYTLDLDGNHLVDVEGWILIKYR